MTWFNEHEPFAAQWLRNLYPSATVDQRSVADVRPADVPRTGRAHFFAGIAGWELALDLAGWPADVPVWTGSCPCQPFSSAGKRKGGDDDRDIWPVWGALIAECRPVVVLGEQVEGAVRHGWLDRLHADLEAEGYAVGAVVLGAHGAGAPHIRQRLWWCAVRVADASRERRDGGAAVYEPGGRRAGAQDRGGLGNADRQRLPQRAQLDGQPLGPELDASRRTDARGPSRRDPWADAVAIPCTDGKWRLVPATAGVPEPALFPLAGRVPGRVGQLRAAGNAIVPQVGAQFARAVLEELAVTA